MNPSTFSYETRPSGDDAFREQLFLLEAESSHLLDLADAARIMGQSELANKLDGIASAIESINAALKACHKTQAPPKA